jgi:tRNA G18 (ribose-2'-O)-methylase SpoU
MRKLLHDELAAARLSPVEALAAARHPVALLLDNIRSLYNVGSLFRTADGALAGRLYLAGHTPRPPRPEIDKTALGATATVPWEHHARPADAVAAARTAGYTICVLEHTTESRPYHEVPRSRFPVCLVVGNELTGVSPEVIDAADMAVEIPMYGSKQSLNAAVAGGIALFELVRIWRSTAGPGQTS